MSNTDGEANLSLSEISISSQESFANPQWIDIFKWILSGTLILSIVCLLLYLIAFSNIPELRKHSGKYLVSLCVAFLFDFICAVAIVMIIGVESNFCEPATWISYYFSMANNLWMCLISFDMWRRLREALTTATFMSGKRSIRFASYSTIAWLLPAIALSVIIFIDVARPAYVSPCFVPGLGRIVCWFSNFCAEILYYIGPILLLLSVSTFFLILARLTVSTSEMSEATTLAILSQQIQLKPFAVLVSLSFIVRIGELINMFLGISYIKIGTLFLKSTLGICYFIGFTCTGNARTAVIQYLSKGSTRHGHSDPPNYHPIHRQSDDVEMVVEPTS